MAEVPQRHRSDPGAWWIAHPIFAAVWQVYLWYGFFHITARGAPTWLLFSYILNALLATGLIISAVGLDRRPAYVLTSVLNAWLLVIVNFSYLYYSHGTRANFTHTLSHLDAVYFTVGTLSTAGTGNISAISESARGIQLAEMLVGLVLVLFAVGLVVSRFAASLTRP